MNLQTPFHIPLWLWWVVGLIVVAVCYRLILRLFGVVLIPQNSIGIVDKRYAVVGKNRTLAEGQIVALNGEAGVQADTLAPGLHFFLWPWQYKIKLQEFLVVPQDSIGVVEARGGIPLTEGRVLGKRVECKAFQDARAFLLGGGQRGPQITMIPPGTYRINTAVFSVSSAKVLEIPVNAVGVVTIKDGKPLNTGEIAGPEVKGHNSFQDAQAFIDAGGYKGLQEQVMLAGRYFINPDVCDRRDQAHDGGAHCQCRRGDRLCRPAGQRRHRRRLQARQSGQQGRKRRLERTAGSGDVPDQSLHADEWSWCPLQTWS